MPTTWNQAGDLGLDGHQLDIKADYKDEVNAAMHQAIACAWVDPDYKAELIANGRKAMADFGVHWPDQYQIEFFEDPSAKIGDWSSHGKNQTGVLRVPIRRRPTAGMSAVKTCKHLLQRLLIAAAAPGCAAARVL